MPAKSQKQAVAARIARAVQKGEVKPKTGSASASMAKMSPEKLKHFTKTEEVSEAVIPKTYQSAIAALTTDCVKKHPNCDLNSYTPAQVIAIIFGMDPARMEEELKKTFEQKLQKAKQRGQIREGSYANDDNLEPFKKRTWKPELEKLLKAIAPAAIDMVNYIGIDEPYDISRETFEDVMNDDIKNPTIRKMWKGMNARQKNALHGHLQNYLHDLAVEKDPEYHGYKLKEGSCNECNCNPCKCKSTMLGDMVKEMSGQQGGMTLNGKKIDTSSIEIEDIDRRDYPDFADAFISAANYEDGTPLTDDELQQLTEEQGEWINWTIHEDQLWL